LDREALDRELDGTIWRNPGFGLPGADSNCLVQKEADRRVFVARWGEEHPDDAGQS